MSFQLKAGQNTALKTNALSQCLAIMSSLSMAFSLSKDTVLCISVGLTLVGPRPHGLETSTVAVYS